MERDRNMPKREQTLRYSRTNPPPDVETAQAAIEKLREDIRNMETDLNNADPKSHIGAEGFEPWRHRAATALRYSRRELAYLESWLSPQKESLSAIANRIRSETADLAEEISRSYTPLFTADNPPKETAEAAERQAYLTGIKQQLQVAFTEVTAAWTSHPLSRNALPGTKAPLQAVLAQVEAELSIVKAFLRKMGLLSSNTSWKAVCAQALIRAVEGGFQLTPVEHAVLCELKRGLPEK